MAINITKYTDNDEVLTRFSTVKKSKKEVNKLIKNQ